MTKFSTFSLAFLAVLALVLTPVAEGGKKKKKADAPAFHPTVIQSVTPNSITISGEGGTKTLEITKFTEITVRGQRATLGDLTPGMRVSVTMGTDPSKASRINASDAPASK